MAGEIFKKKMDLLFRSLDMTNDGVIDRTDGDLVIEEMAGDDPDFRAVAERFWMVFAKMDANGAYRIDQAQFRWAMERSMLYEDSFDFVIGPVAERWFGLYDADADGSITFDEYARWLGFRHAEPSDLKQGFDSLDRNGDGLVSREEWMAGLKEFCSSDEPNVPGNLLMGPLG